MNIQIAITPDFMAAHAKLPTKIQPKVWEAVSTFQNIPKATGLNYEKLNALDNSLRSIRVTQNYRIIMGVDHTNVHYLLHVNTHDNAYDWGKTKRFSYNDLKRNAMVFTIPEMVALEPVLATADTTTLTPIFEDCTDEQLLHLGVPKDWLPSIKKITHSDQLLSLLERKDIPEEAVENLMLVEEGTDVRTVITSLEAIQAEQQALITNFYVLTEDDNIATILSSDFASWRLFLHPDQREIAYKEMKGSAKVTGGAGTGKTVVAIHRAKFLADKLKEGDAPIFFTTYTKSLITNLKRLLRLHGIPTSKLLVNNLHSQCRTLAVQYGLVPNKFGIMYQNKAEQFWQDYSDELGAGFSGAFLYEEYNQVILQHQITTPEDYMSVIRTGRKDRLSKADRQVVWEVVEHYWDQKAESGYYTFEDLMYLVIIEQDKGNQPKPFSYVICDEIQDFTNLELRFIRSLCPEQDNDLFLVGDPLQNIYGKTTNFSQSAIQIRGRSKRLKVNYRTTEEIKQRAVENVKGFSFSNFEDATENLKGYRSVMHGTEPNYILFATWQEEKKALAQQLTSIEQGDELALNECCVALRSRTKLEELGEQLSELDIPFQYLRDIKDFDIPQKGVTLSTFHGMKGMEFKKVFLLNVSDSTVPRRPSEYNELPEAQQKLIDRSEFSLLYVAMSRAVNSLEVSGNGTAGWSLWG